MDKMTYLYDRIEEELDDAHGYLQHAIKCKEHSPEMASVLYKLSSEELQHAQTLQSLAAQEIAARRKDALTAGGDEMMAIHEWLRCRHADCIKDIKKMQDVFAGK